MTTWDEMLAWGVEKGVDPDAELTVLVTLAHGAHEVLGLSCDADGNVFLITRPKL